MRLVITYIQSVEAVEFSLMEFVIFLKSPRTVGGSSLIKLVITFTSLGNRSGLP
jgi:hypothetical protein